MMLDLVRGVLEEFAAFPRGVLELRVTNQRHDNETNAAFRRGRRACGIACACGGRIYPPDHGGAAARTCLDCKRRARAERDRGRRR
jgi:hypothetical protein